MHSVIALESIFTKIEENKLSSGFFLKMSAYSDSYSSNMSSNLLMNFLFWCC